MPQIILRWPGEQKWARFDKEGKGFRIRWAGIEEAMRFDSPEAAAQGFAGAIAQMRSSAITKAEKANAKGGRKLSAGNISWKEREAFKKASALLAHSVRAARAQEILKSADDWTKKRFASQSPEHVFASIGWVQVPADPTDYLPEWLDTFKPICESLARPDELLDPMEIWFVRCSKGWLAPSPGGKGLSWAQELHQAKPFLSREAAQSAADSAQGARYALCKGNMLFSQVFAPHGADANDAIGCALATGCEAREIDSEIRQAAENRKSAIQKRSSSAPKPRL